MIISSSYVFVIFLFNDTATTEISTLSLHDALPIYGIDVACDLLQIDRSVEDRHGAGLRERILEKDVEEDRKSTRLNSSHDQISYAVFCLKKKTTRRRN